MTCHDLRFDQSLQNKYLFIKYIIRYRSRRTPIFKVALSTACRDKCIFCLDNHCSDVLQYILRKDVMGTNISFLNYTKYENRTKCKWIFAMNNPSLSRPFIKTLWQKKLVFDFLIRFMKIDIKQMIYFK